MYTCIYKLYTAGWYNLYTHASVAQIGRLEERRCAEEINPIKTFTQALIQPRSLNKTLSSGGRMKGGKGRFDFKNFCLIFAPGGFSLLIL